MKKAGKRYRLALELTKQAGLVKDLAQGVSLVKRTAKAKFDETIVVSSHLGVDPRHAEQLVRGTVVLPHGTGKSALSLQIAARRDSPTAIISCHQAETPPKYSVIAMIETIAPAKRMIDWSTSVQTTAFMPPTKV